jgi:hypothetical protein
MWCRLPQGSMVGALSNMDVARLKVALAFVMGLAD